MIKNKIKKILFASFSALALFTSCEDESKNPQDIQLDDDNTAPFVRLIPETSIFDISMINDASYIGTLSAPADNVSSWTVGVYRISSGVSSDTITLKTITDFPADLEITTTEISDALDINISDFLAGDNIQFVASSVGDNGKELTYDDLSGTLKGQPEQHQAFNFGLFVGCPETEEPIDIVPGDWVINMTDAYGDGWQPGNADGGGPGITVTLSDGTVFEIGLCTPYEDPGYDCTDELSSGTATITIPDGLTDADWEWTFNGDHWGEMGYEIFTPNGNLVGVRGPAAQPEPNVIDDLLLCAQ